MSDTSTKEEREKELLDKLTSNFRSIVNRPIHHTSFQEVALQAITVLGKEYFLIRENKGWSIFLNSSFNALFEYSQLVSMLTSLTNLEKCFGRVQDFHDRYHRSMDQASTTCQIIEQVIKNQHQEQIAQEEERIEREETIRARCRNWR